MKRKLMLTALLLAALLMLGPYHPARAADDGCALQIQATGFASTGGQAGVMFYRTEKEMFAHPFRKAYAPIVKGQATLRVEGLPAGTYAVVVFHDENGNGTVDHSFLGFPAEPLGFPSGYTRGLIALPPSFADLRIAFACGAGDFKARVE